MERERFRKYIEQVQFDGEQVPLYIMQSAQEVCVPSKVATWYKDNLDEWSLHYVYLGKGYIEYGGKKVKIEAGNLFLVPPLTDVVYYPDPNDPFAYYWVKVRGKMVAGLLWNSGFDTDNLVLKPKRALDVIDHFAALVDSYFHDDDGYQSKMLGHFYLIMAELSEYQKMFKKNALSEKQLYVKKAMFFIEYNYLHPIKMKDIASDLNIHVNYLCNIFTDEVGISPKNYLLKLRMEKAKQFLLQMNVGIKEIAYRVGYADPLYFSKIFCKAVGCSPTEYRKNNAKK